MVENVDEIDPPDNWWWQSIILAIPIAIAIMWLGGHFLVKWGWLV